MRFIYEGIPFILGVEWGLVSNAKDEKTLSAQHKGCKKIRLKLSEQSKSPERIVGFIPQKKEHKKGWIAACAAGKVFDRGIFVVELNEEQVWVCHVLNGLPVPGGDIVLSKKDAQEHISEIRALSDAPLKTYLLNGEGDASADEFWLQLVSAVKDQSIPRITVCKVDDRTLLYVALAGVTAAVAGGIFYVNSLTNQPPPKPQLPAIPKVTNQEDEQLKKERERLLQLKRNYEQAVSNAISQVKEAYKGVPDTWIHAVGKIPMGYFGYKLQTITCTPEGCEVVWKNGEPNERFVRGVRYTLPFIDEQKTKQTMDERTAYSFISLKPEQNVYPKTTDVRKSKSFIKDFFSNEIGYTVVPLFQDGEPIKVDGVADINAPPVNFGKKVVAKVNINLKQKEFPGVYLGMTDFMRKMGFAPKQVVIKFNNSYSTGVSGVVLGASFLGVFKEQEAQK